ncbi:MAG TPA: bifunctional phosphoribosylaminoimidazolecarboxamide formyltransferase/IMP cyclohydrolase, partial [Pyrinomonadaceae bacterium]|nr:bifunctional phosphoribosylaminoimidazolecarboxamide formyltransferase/IMP cyclohydrolase [Pyrinomonadaceae bacterium]
KNHAGVAVVVSPDDYAGVLEELSSQDGALSLSTRRRLARLAFHRTAIYDFAIYAYLESKSAGAHGPGGVANGVGGGHGADSETGGFPQRSHPFEQALPSGGGLPASMSWTASRTAELRYGENPHQQAALYNLGEMGGVARAEVLAGKEMSFNNYVDADAAWQLVCDFEETACAIIKHMNPSGVGVAATLEEAYRRALATDPVSAFGGIVAFNRNVDAATARAVTEIFTEVVIAPDFDAEAVEVLKSKKNLRVLRAGRAESPQGFDFKRITGGLLVQTRDTHRLTKDALKVVSKRAPTDEETAALLFAWTVCKHTKSNAIVYARAGQTVGVGAGQMSRVDSVRIGAMRARLAVEGSVLASDAFFPFRDGIDEAAKHGITAVIQPGGSVRDNEIIAAADEHDLAMVFTGIRHFRH